MTTIETITVREIIDPAGIGGNDTEWSETVRSTTEAALAAYIEERWPSADADIEVTIGRAGESKRSVFVNDGPAPSAIERDLRDVSERAFEKCCG